MQLKDRALTVALLGAALLPRPASAKFARIGEPVPLPRLLENVGKYVQAHPKDPQGHYTQGRLHSLAFAKRTTEVDAELLPDRLPNVALHFFSIQEPREKSVGPLDAEAKRHLAESIRSYTRATQLDPKNSVYWLGLGWMLEQGARWSPTVPAKGQPQSRDLFAPLVVPAKGQTLRVAIEDAALAAYRKAYALDLNADLKNGHLGPGADSSISLEAGEGILRLLKPRKLDARRKGEVNLVTENVTRLKNLPRAITPILFPLEDPAPLSQLLAPGKTAMFDLAGDGRPERWPWVAPETGILVWDPHHTGHIISGRQLFGTGTWSMFWKDGYAPLAALDDNGDGVLAGAELEGLAVWQDRNGNAVSDPGEVRPLASLGVVRLTVTAETAPDGLRFQPHGLELRSGRRLPTYDWTPTSLPRFK